MLTESGTGLKNMEEDKTNNIIRGCRMESKKEKKRILTGKIKQESRSDEKKEWKKPTLEDVSGRVMAQPYIRFT